MTADYVDDALYARLHELVGAPPRGAAHRELRPVAESVVFDEARLLDDRRYREWLARFGDECVYWVPIEPGLDPRDGVAYFFDDRSRLEDRVALLETGWAHAQVPASRTCRSVAGVDAWPLDDGGLLIRCAVTVWEYRHERVETFASTNRYVVDAADADWRIRYKIVSLVNAGGDVPPFTFIL